MFDMSEARSVLGQQLLSSDGTKIGKIGQVYLDVRDQPEWVTVDTGLFGTDESFVPLAEAALTSKGVTVPYTKDDVRDAPNIGDAGQLNEPEERQLHEYYNVPYSSEQVRSGKGRLHKYIG